MKLIAALVVVACFSVAQCSEYCRHTHDGFTYTWYCTFSCCFDYDFCCQNYWYAWTGASLVFLFCLCFGIGCGGYRYRRYYVVRRTYHQPVGTATVVTTANTTTYQPQPAYGSSAPPPYK